MISDLSSDTRGQVYILEAILAVVLILTVTFFIAPSIATISYDAQLNDVTEEEQIEDKVDAVFAKHAENGNLKEATLQFGEPANINDTGETFYLEPPNQFFIASDKNISYIVTLNGSTAPLAEDIRDLQEKHGVVINAYIIADTGDGDPQRIPWIVQAHPGNTIGSTTTTVTLYKTDRLQSPQMAHTHLGTPLTPAAGTGVELQNVSSSDTNYPITQHPDVSSDSEVYNTVTIKVLVFKETKVL